jgi:hypothetical protein
MSLLWSQAGWLAQSCELITAMTADRFAADKQFEAAMSGCKSAS